MTEFPEFPELHEGWGHLLPTVKAQEWTVRLLQQPHDGSLEDLARLMTGLQIIDRTWVDGAEHDTFDPETAEIMTRFVQTFWDPTNVLRTEICLFLIGMGDLSGLIGLMATASTSPQPFIRWRVMQALSISAHHYTVFDTVRKRLRVIWRLMPVDLVPAEAKIAQEVVLGLQGSLPLSYTDLGKAVPRYDLLEQLNTVLGRKWMSVLRRVWILNLMTDYRSLFSGTVYDHSDLPQPEKGLEWS